MAKLDKFFHKVQYLFTRRWNADIIGTLVESVNDEINGRLPAIANIFLRHRASEALLGCSDPSLCAEYNSRRTSQNRSDRSESWTRRDDNKARDSCFAVSLKSK